MIGTPSLLLTDCWQCYSFIPSKDRAKKGKKEKSYIGELRKQMIAKLISI